jgi:hypothetical protein
MTHMQRAHLSLEICYKTVFLNFKACIRRYNKEDDKQFKWKFLVGIDEVPIFVLRKHKRLYTKP